MLVKFFDHSGVDVWVNPLQVRTVRAEQVGRSSGGYAPGGVRAEARTLIQLGSDRSNEVRVDLPIEVVLEMLAAAAPDGM